MKSAPFAYDAPDRIEGALALLQEYGSDAKILAGGQSLVPLMNMRLAKPAVLVDVNRISSMQYIRVESDGSLAIGAGTRQAAAERSPEVAASWPLLTEALKQVGHTTIRNRGTIGGSLAHADPAAELPVAALALDATFRLVGPLGERTVRAREAYVTYLTTVIEPDEILVEVRFPPRPRGGGSSFLEISRRHGDYALVAAAAAVSLDADGACTGVNVALGGVGETPVLVAPSNGELTGRRLDEATVREAARLYTADLAPSGDVHADPEYRKEVAEVLVRRALLSAAARASKEA
ncbi:MAG: xanthine dehydrogenase family protein subunit M [Chloroflexi bacterium]|nr:xanthine dehydrogenase family protein subunit M [Chloroflexota bacterium]